MKIVYLIFLFNLLYHSTFSQNIIEYQKFTINSEHDTTLIGKYGTEIFIPTGSFKSTPLPIQIRLKEIFSIDEFVLEQVNTESKEGVLASDGMILIEAAIGTQAVDLVEGKKIEIRIPTFESSSSMEVYSRTEDTLGGWEKSNIPLRLDTCEERTYRIVWDRRKVTKEKYEEWKKSTPVEDRGPTKALFGGKNITIGKAKNKTPKAYYIPFPKDTICKCEGPSIAKYIFSIQNFGWYNIDRLLEEYEKLYSFKLYAPVDLNFFLILGEDTCIRGRKRDDYYFFRAPHNAVGKLIGYRKVGDNEMLISVVERFSVNQKEVRLQREPLLIGNGAMHKWLREID